MTGSIVSNSSVSPVPFSPVNTQPDILQNCHDKNLSDTILPNSIVNGKDRLLMKTPSGIHRDHGDYTKLQFAPSGDATDVDI